jgi:hypothetical protein
MNIFHHKDLENHLLQLRPKVVKHPVYTDKSKTDKGVGSAVAIFELGQYIKSIQRRLKNAHITKQNN